MLLLAKHSGSFAIILPKNYKEERQLDSWIKFSHPAHSADCKLDDVCLKNGA